MKPLGRTTRAKSGYALARGTHDRSHVDCGCSDRDTAAVESPLRLRPPAVGSQGLGRRLFPELPNESCRNIADRHTRLSEQLRLRSSGRQHHLHAAPAIRDGSPRSQQAPRGPRPRCHRLSGCCSLLRSNHMDCSLETRRSHGEWAWIFGRSGHLEGRNFSGRSRPRDAQRERVSRRPTTDACHRTGFDLETRLSWCRPDDARSVRRTVLGHPSTGQISADGSRWQRAMSAGQSDNSIGQDHRC